jgi:hypothetical protein
MRRAACASVPPGEPVLPAPSAAAGAPSACIAMLMNVAMNLELLKVSKVHKTDDTTNMSQLV